MSAAPLTDLDAISLNAEEAAVSAEASAVPSLLTTDGIKQRLDTSLLQSAKLVRRVRIDRAAIRIARTGTAQPDEDEDLLLGPAKIKWLKGFTKDFENTEPDLVQTLHQGALHRAFNQGFVDLFQDAVTAFRGPEHDRQNSLLLFFFHREAQGKERQTEQAFNRYTGLDLPQNTRLSEPLRNALLSECFHRSALDLMEPESPMPFPFSFGRDKRNNDKKIESLLKQAAAAYPANRNVYKSQIEWLTSKLEDDRLEAAERKAWEARLPVVMKCWTKALPEDFEPKLWLVEHLLENGELDEARPFVEWLQVARQDDPVIKAMPWKFQLLEAMRLCRRKAWIPDVPEKLQSAEAAWPAWLSRDWVPYLHAARQLRSGDNAGYEQQRAAICAAQHVTRDSLRDACMMLGAAQSMQVPAAELKPLRVPIDAAVKGVKQLSTDDLVAVGEFFWDLHRTHLVYPAYRMHGSKFGRELINRLAKKSTLIDDRIQQPPFLAAMLWASEHRFWGDGYQANIPDGLDRYTEKIPLIAAAKVNAFVKLRWNMSDDECEPELTLLKSAEGTERDPFYRHWFAVLQQVAQTKLEQMAQRGFGSGFGSMFDAIAGAFGLGAAFDDDEDQSEFYDDEEDDECDCEACRARRALELADHRSAPGPENNPIEAFFRDAF
ncbi:MAG: hypothetical protein R3C59_08845 [Planctomycetaceae bacterium]